MISERHEFQPADLIDPNNLVQTCAAFSKIYYSQFTSATSFEVGLSEKRGRIVRSFDLLNRSLISVFPQYRDEYNSQVNTGKQGLTDEFMLMQKFLLDIKDLSICLQTE